MYMSQNIVETGLPGIGIVTTAERLAVIRRPDMAAVLWNREIPMHVQDWVDALRSEHLPEVRVILPPDILQDAVQAVFETCGTPDCAESRWLIEDITTLGAVFTEAMQTRYLRLRLNVVTGDSCRRFHTDAVRARLICTYRGAGTQYTFAGSETDAEQIHTAPTGCPMILRGTDWRETPPSGLLHRSPPIEGTGETRLLLVLDHLDDPEDEA